MAKKLKPPGNLYIVFDPDLDLNEAFNGKDDAIVGSYTTKAVANSVRQNNEIVLHYSFIAQDNE